jgi:hypothetical protein
MDQRRSEVLGEMAAYSGHDLGLIAPGDLALALRVAKPDPVERHRAQT